MARYIRVKGDEIQVEPDKHNKVRNGKRKFTLEEIQRMVGQDELHPATIQPIRLPHGRTMYVDDEGSINGSLVNVKASEILQAELGPRPTVPICGNVVIVEKGEF